MTVKNIIPIEPGVGSLGKDNHKWENVFTNKLNNFNISQSSVENGVVVSNSNGKIENNWLNEDVVLKTIQDKIIYINSDQGYSYINNDGIIFYWGAGNNTIGDGTLEHPYASLNKVIDLMPDIIDNDLTIIFAGIPYRYSWIADGSNGLCFISNKPDVTVRVINSEDPTTSLQVIGNNIQITLKQFGDELNNIIDLVNKSEYSHWFTCYLIGANVPINATISGETLISGTIRNYGVADLSFYGNSNKKITFTTLWENNTPNLGCIFNSININNNNIPLTFNTITIDGYQQGEAIKDYGIKNLHNNSYITLNNICIKNCSSNIYSNNNKIYISNSNMSYSNIAIEITEPNTFINLEKCYGNNNYDVFKISKNAYAYYKEEEELPSESIPEDILLELPDIHQTQHVSFLPQDILVRIINYNDDYIYTLNKTKISSTPNNILDDENIEIIENENQKYIKVPILPDTSDTEYNIILDEGSINQRKSTNKNTIIIFNTIFHNITLTVPIYEEELKLEVFNMDIEISNFTGTLSDYSLDLSKIIVEDSINGEIALYENENKGYIRIPLMPITNSKLYTIQILRGAINKTLVEPESPSAINEYNYNITFNTEDAHYIIIEESDINGNTDILLDTMEMDFNINTNIPDIIYIFDKTKINTSPLDILNGDPILVNNDGQFLIRVPLLPTAYNETYTVNINIGALSYTSHQGLIRNEYAVTSSFTTVQA